MDEAYQREEKKRETKDTMQKFLLERQEKQQAMERAEKEEHDRIEAYAKAKREREAALAAEAERVAVEKNKVLKNMIGVVEARNKEKEELEQLRNDLHMEQLEAEQRQRDEKQMMQKRKDREEMKSAYRAQMREKDEKVALARKEEEQFQEILLKKFAEDDRIEQMNEQKRRMKLQEHKREAQRLIVVRREMFEAARAQERAQQEKLRDEERERQLIIEVERKRLLQEHAVGLRDFLPKQTLETQEDYELLFADRLAASQTSGGYTSARSP